MYYIYIYYIYIVFFAFFTVFDFLLNPLNELASKNLNDIKAEIDGVIFGVILCSSNDQVIAVQIKNAKADHRIIATDSFFLVWCSV